MANIAMGLMDKESHSMLSVSEFSKSGKRKADEEPCKELWHTETSPKKHLKIKKAREKLHAAAAL
jgi:hypothetical protein